MAHFLKKTYPVMSAPTFLAKVLINSFWINQVKTTQTNIGYLRQALGWKSNQSTSHKMARASKWTFPYLLENKRKKLFYTCHDKTAFAIIYVDTNVSGILTIVSSYR